METHISTDTTAALRAAEVEADVILMGKNNVDGVYSADPKVNKDAVKYEHLTHIQMLQEGFTSNGFNSILILYG